jgi:catechol 2,3-dioxygenase-like lactoylglutathione lyase family enzyme
MNLRFDHVHIFARDVDAMAQWFAIHLGATVQRSEVRTEASLGSLRLFFQKVQSDQDRSGNGVLDHLAFAVEGIDALATRLEAGGALFAKPLHEARPGVRALFLEGPERLRVEILERTAAP